MACRGCEDPKPPTEALDLFSGQKVPGNARTDRFPGVEQDPSAWRNHCRMSFGSSRAKMAAATKIRSQCGESERHVSPLAARREEFSNFIRLGAQCCQPQLKRSRPLPLSDRAG